MNLYLSPSGYNFFWQWGVLDGLKDHIEMEKIHAISGGTIALGYHSMGAKPKDFADFWVHVSKSPKQYMWFYREMQDQMKSVNRDLHVGVTKLSGFSWERFNYSDTSTWHNAICTCTIPFVNVIPSKHNFKYGIDGGISFNDKKIRKDNLLSINAYSYFRAVKDADSAIINHHKPIPIFLKKSKNDLIKNYYDGLKQCEDEIRHVLK